MERLLRASMAAALAACLFACSAEPDAVPGVRLGMTPHDVRERLVTGGEGTWQTRVGASTDDTAVEWSAKDATRAFVVHATFEFHLGMLVAVRATVRDADGKERVVASKRTVTLRRPSAPGVAEITVLARDCPTHRDEAEKLATQAR